MSLAENKKTSVGAVMVVGGGIAGMQSALDLADSGFRVYLVERDISIGGVMAQLDKTFPTNDCSTCMISPKLIEVSSNPNIEIISRAKVLSLEGQPGNFTARVRQEPRFIDLNVCSACGECVKVCPVEVPATFNEGLGRRKAVYRHFPQAIPSAFAIDKLGTSPCKAACPAGVSAQGYVALIAQGKFKEALALVRRDNPLPGICGRVCTHPCESQCSRGQVDEPVAIRDLKKFVADWEVEHGQMDLPDLKPKRSEKVAVIGSGPAGLTAAYYLAIEGFQPTVFEALPEAGGMLKVGIPDYRLPARVLDYEVDYIKAVGVDIRTGVKFGEDVTIESLERDGYKAVFLSVGAHGGLKLRIPGEDGAEGVIDAVEYLRDMSLGKPRRPGDKVVVIGGGNVAIDAARTARRQGAKVTVVYRRTQKEMPAYHEEIEEAVEEGVEFVFLASPTKIISSDGRVVGFECIRNELGPPDGSGRRRPIPIKGGEFVIDCDAVIPAIGQVVDAPWAVEIGELAWSKRMTLEVDPISLQTSMPNVFAGGDAVSGPDTAIKAIAAGKRAAESIRRFLDDEDLVEGREKPVVLAEVDTDGLPRAPRHKPAAADAETRLRNFDEVTGVFDEKTAIAEASRCLACGICSECYQCVKACQAGAIRHDAVAEEMDLAVGAVVMAPGFRPFDARLKPEYGYGRLANVITSLEFERLNSASGPTGGHIHRPSDAKEPKRVAWIQCVGSRDPSIGRDYCSYVCCMYASKQAIIGQEHLPGMKTTIFYMDVRAQGKGFDRYYERAKNEHGVRYVRSMISRVLEDPVTKDLEVQYFTENDELVTETFDLLVLSVGLSPHPASKELAQTLGVETDRFGFAARQGLNPLATSRPGVFACGVFQAPRDIPDTVMQAGAAAAEAGALLANARGTEIVTAEFPDEIDFSGQAPRIGIFVCHCGINIGGIVNVPSVVEYARTLPYVEYADEYLFTCSTDSQGNMADLIREHGLNRVVIASCSPRTHEPLFQETLRKSGLNPYLFEMANIRDQCSWVHQDDHPAATAKAKDLVRMSAARAALLEPVHKFPVPVEQTALVIGGGPAGLTAAVSLAEQGFRAHIVERSDRLGGLANRLTRNLEGDDVRAFIESLKAKVQADDRIEVHLNSEVVEYTGRVGMFTTRIAKDGRETSIDHGAVVVATGAAEYRPTEYGYGKDERVLTQLSLHEQLSAQPGSLTGVNSVVMIQCVGSRNEEHSYCSRICCGQAVANALRIKELRPETDVTVLFRDMRTFALKELYYREARDKGVRFVRFEPERAPEIAKTGRGLEVSVYDSILGETLLLPADRVVLSAAVRPQPDAKKFASNLKLPLDADGFFMEAHLKLRPVDFVSAGFFLAGAAHGPKYLEECVSQAKAAAARAATLLSKSEMPAGGEVAEVDQEKCVCCLTCVRTCPFGVPKVDENNFAFIDPAACKGCGSCASACPRGAIQVRHHKDDQMIAKCTALFGEV